MYLGLVTSIHDKDSNNAELQHNYDVNMKTHHQGLQDELTNAMKSTYTSTA